tara:strand:+ start:156 stop:578 length:423 start_codon:yes stop_codon:yes gene_type:complete
MHKKKNIAIFVAARSGSKRLKNKHFLKINSELSVIDLCILRLKKTKITKKIFLCTTKKKILIGYVRLELNKNKYNTSWAILKEFSGKGYAKKALNYATKYKQLKYKAIIKKDNLASINVATSTKFVVKKKIKNLFYLYKN